MKPSLEMICLTLASTRSRFSSGQFQVVLVQYIRYEYPGEGLAGALLEVNRIKSVLILGSIGHQPSRKPVQAQARMNKVFQKVILRQGGHRG